jgi:diketogulonate reductase-like aldo/keto reductase
LATLDRLQLDYIDCFLIHWPAKQGLKSHDERNATLRRDSWKALERLFREGKVRAIGISNYTIAHLDDLLAYAEIPPHVLQVEFHPLLFQSDLLAYCRHHQIHLQAYSSFGEGQLVQSPPAELTRIARDYNVSVAQVLLRWAHQHDVSVIPKASSQNHLVSNVDIFTFHLSDTDMMALNQLSLSNSPRRFCWDPNTVK